MSEEKTVKEWLWDAAESITLNDPASALNEIDAALEVYKKPYRGSWFLIGFLTALPVGAWFCGHSILKGGFFSASLFLELLTVLDIAMHIAALTVVFYAVLKFRNTFIRPQ